MGDLPKKSAEQTTDEKICAIQKVNQTSRETKSAKKDDLQKWADRFRDAFDLLKLLF
jgi:hypothetical protein